MNLRTANEQRAHQRDAEAAAQVAHEIENAGAVANLFAAEVAHSGGGQRDKNETDGNSIENARKNDVPHGDFEIDVAEPKGRDGEQNAGGVVPASENLQIH